MRPIYAPITRRPSLSVNQNPYNDARLAAKSLQLLGRMIDRQSNVVHRLSWNDSEEKSFYRFLNNKRVCPQEMLEHLFRPALPNLSHRDLLVIGDTSEVSLKGQIAQIQDRDRIGVLSDNKTPGFYLHSDLVLDAQSGHGLGLSNLLFWTRPPSSLPKRQAHRGDQRNWSEKETYRWMTSIQGSQSVLCGARSILYVFDSEADLANLWSEASEASYDLLIRSQQHNRKLAGPGGKLADFLTSLSISGTYPLPLRGLERRNISRSKAQKRTARTAQMEVRFAPVELELGTETGKKVLMLYAVDTRESTSTVPEGEVPVHWRLLTTRPVETLEQAMKIIQCYEWRWRTEELYRAAKKKGLGIEQTQLTTFDAILKQTSLSMKAAFKVLQLVNSRDKGQHQPISELFSPEEIQCMERLNLKCEGSTQKQKNPWPKDQLAWAAWVIARLGGWKGYQTRRPPGPIRMKRGLERFNTYFDAWKLFVSDIDVGEP